MISKNGFTLVEIAIGMLIIGLIIGGIFGGMQLVENAKASRQITDFKSIEAATATFISTYGRPPGDLRNPSSRIAGCSSLPCSRSGNGNRQIGAVLNISSYSAADTENLSFWHHLKASEVYDADVQAVNNPAFGIGQPYSKLSRFYGYRIAHITVGIWNYCPGVPAGSTVWLAPDATGDMMRAGNADTGLRCRSIRNMDVKLDDGLPYLGRMTTFGCADNLSCNTPYSEAWGDWTFSVRYRFRGF